MRKNPVVGKRLMKKQSLRRALNSLVATVASFAVLIAGIVVVQQPASAAPVTSRVIQVLGKMDKFFVGNGTDSELRLDYVLEVPAGVSLKASGGFSYDFDGNGSLDNMAASIINTPNLGGTDYNQQYRIVRRDNFGDRDRLTVSLQGDLGGAYDTAPANPCDTGAIALPVRTFLTNGETVDFTYRTTLYNVASTCATAKIAPILSYDNIYGNGNSQTNWGYVVSDTNPVVPANKMLVKFISPLMNKTTTVCTTATSFYYQWVRSDGTPADSITPQPVQLNVPNPTADYNPLGAAEIGKSIIDVASAGQSFVDEGPGYYRLMAWPVATTKTGGTDCSDYSYYADSVGNIASPNAFTMGSVFYTGGQSAVQLTKNFQNANPLPIGTTSQAHFVLNSGNTRLPGVGFTDTLPADLVFTGEITQDTCGFQTKSITQSQYDALQSPLMKTSVSPGPQLQISSDKKTISLQGQISFDIQTGSSEIAGAVISRGANCEVSATVKHVDSVTAPKACTASVTTDSSLTNNVNNLSYLSIMTVPGFKAPQTGFGDCLPVVYRNDLSITVDPVAADVAPGANTTRTFTVTNAGPSFSANTPSATLNAPAGTTFAPAPAGCTLNGAATVATCPVGVMQLGETKTFAAQLKVPTTATIGQSLSGTGTVSDGQSPTADPNSANDSTSFSINVIAPWSDLSVENVSTPALAPGAAGAQTVTIKNNGPSNTTAASVNYTAPTGVTIVSATNGACVVSADKTSATCSGLSLAADATLDLAFNIKVSSAVDPATSPLTLASGAVVTESTDKVADNNSRDVSVTVGAASAVLNVAAQSKTVAPGATTTIPVTVTNAGPSDASAPAGAFATFTAPPGTQVQGSVTSDPALSCTVSGDSLSVSCALTGTLVSGSALNFAVPLVTDAAASNGQVVNGSATAASPTADPSSKLTGDFTVTYSAASADLVASVNRPSVTPGGQANYIITATNQGPSVAAAPRIVFTLPTNVSNPVVPVGCSVAGAVVTCDASESLAPSANVSFTIPVTASSAGAVVANGKVEVSSTTADPMLANNVVSSTPLDYTAASADLSIVKTKPATAPVAGASSTWTIAVTNNGPSDATDVVVTDKLAAGLTFVSATGATCQAVGQDVTCAVGTLANGATATISLETSLDATTPAGTVVANAASAHSNTPDPNTANDTTPSVPADPSTVSSDLSIVKTKPSTAPVAGSNSTWSIAVTNNGPSDAKNVVITDVLPEGLSFVSGTNATCSAVGQTVTCAIPNLATGGQVLVGLVTKVAETTPAGTVLSNAASASSDSVDSNPANNTTPSVPADPSTVASDLSITKTKPATAPVAGSDTTWTITVTNNGPSDAANVVVHDTLAAGLSFVSATGATCSATGQDVSCAVGTLANGASATITLTTHVAATIAAGTVISNTASATSDSVDANPANNTTPSVPADPSTVAADLSITKTKPATAPVAGSDTTWTINVTNNGPSDATNVVVQDKLAAGLTFVSATGATCSATGQDVSCAVGTLANGATASIALTTRLATTTPVGTVISNAASASSDAVDPNPANNTTPDVPADPSTTVADLSVSKSAPAAAPVAGQDTTWTISVKNFGPSEAKNVVIHDTLVAGLSFVSATGATCSAVGQEVTCVVGDMAFDASASIVLTTHVAANVPANTVLQNKASITSDTSDNNPANNVTPDVPANGTAAAADLSVSKSKPAAAPVAGSDTTWTIAVHNFGPSDATGVTITDVLPNGLTFVSATGADCSAAGATVTCVVGDLANGADASIELTTHVSADLAANTVIANSASVSGEQIDNNETNNETPSVPADPSVASADLSVVKTVQAGAPIAGQNMTWTIAVTNSGPSDARNVVISDQLANGLTFVSATNATCSATGQDVSCAVPTLRSGDAVSVTVTVLVSASTPAGTVFRNSASVTSDTGDLNSSNNTTPDVPALQSKQQADLSITKTKPASAPVAGSDTTWTIAVHNAGPSDASNVVVTDTLPAGLSFVSATGATCSVVEQDVTCLVGTLAANGDASIALTTRVGADVAVGTTIKNSAAVDSDATDDNSANDVTPEVPADPTTVAANLSVTKTAADTAPVAGQDTTWTIAVHNAGPSDATHVTVTDTLADGLSFVSATGATCSAEGQVVTCDLGTVLNGADASIVLTTRVAANVAPGTVLQNAATASSDATDPDPSDNTTPDVNSKETESAADLSIVKTKPTKAPLAGTPTTWTITVHNDGPSDASDVVVHDSLPAGLSFTSATGATCSASGQDVSCAVGTIANGATVTIALVTLVGSDVLAGTTIANTASVTSSTTDSNSSNDVTPAVPADPSTAAADLSVVKTKPSSAPVAGQDSTWTIAVTNNGPSTARAVTVSDVLDSQLSFVSATGATCSASDQDVTCVVGDLASGATASISLTTRVAATLPTGTVIENSATANSTTPDPNADNNITEPVAADPSAAVADLAIVKTASSTAPVAGQNTTWTLSVTNNGPSTATNVVVSDTLDSTLSFVSATGATCSAADQLVSCAVGTVAVGQTKTIQLTTLVAANVAADTVISNAASVGSDASDPTSENNTTPSVPSVPTTAVADLGITKTAPTTAPVAGSPMTWTIGVTNFGPSDATNIVITDVLPDGLTFVSGSNATCSADGQTVTCLVPRLAASGQLAIALVVAVSADLPQDTVLENAASVRSDATDPNSGNDSTPKVPSLPTTLEADLSITKTAPEAAPVAGSDTTWTISVHNSGPSAAPNVVVTDQLAAGLSFVSATGATCVATGQAVSCDLGTLAAGADATIALTTRVAANVAPGTVIANAAAVSSAAKDTNDDNNVTPGVEAKPSTVGSNLSITKSAPEGSPVAGSNMTWTITVTNHGPSDATGVTVSDALASELSFVSATGATCSAAGQDVSCDVGTLRNGQSATISLTTLVAANVAPDTVFQNSATVGSDVPDPDPSDNTTPDVDSKPSSAIADLSISKQAPTAAPVPGTDITWTILVRDNGPSDATGVVVTDTLQAGLSFVSATGADCSADGQQVTCVVGDLANGQTATIALTTHVASDVADGTEIANSASVTSDVPDDNDENNDTPEVPADPSEASADLAIVKTAPAAAPIAGADSQWTITVHNFGPSDAKNVIVTDPLVDGLTFVSATGATCSAAGQVVSCAVGDIAKGADATITLTTRVAASTPAGTVIKNTATVSSDTTDSNDKNDTTPEVSADPSVAVADLAIVKRAPASAPVAGSDTTWTIDVTNNGPSNATNVTVTDVLPAGLTFVSGTNATCAAVDQTVTCVVSTLATGAQVSIGLTTRVDAATPVGTVIANTASAKSDATDPNDDNDVTPEVPSEPTVGKADLSITKTAAAAAPVAGQNTTWTISVHNAGPSNATNVVVTDTLTDGLSFVSATGGTCAADGQLVSCSLGTIANGGDATITITTRVAANTPAGTVIVNAASVTSDLPDDNDDNNVTPEVPSEPTTAQADLGIVKTASATAPVAGQNTTWNIVVTNNGPSDAQNVQITDVLLPQLSFVSASGANCSADAQVVTCELGTIASGTSATIQLTTLLAADTPIGTVITNSASVKSDTTDDNDENNDTPEVPTEPSEGAADLSISKAAPAVAPQAGTDSVWTITVHNAGPSDATKVVVSDTLASQLSFVSATGATCAAAGQDVTCDLGTVANGATVVISLTTKVASSTPAGTVIANAASVTSETPDDNAENNDTPEVPAEESTTSADLSIVKTAPVQAPVAGSDTTWTLTVHNAGPSDAQAVVVQDTLMAGLSFVSATGASCSAAGQLVSCDLGTVANGATIVISLVTQVDSNVAPGTVIANSASVKSDTPDDNDDNDDTPEVPTEPSTSNADLSITKQAPTTAPVAGAGATWSITVHNAGPSDAKNVIITDTLASELTFVSATGADCSAVDQVVTCDLGTVVNGATVRIALTTRLAANTPVGSVIANSASVQSDTPDDNDDNNDTPEVPSDPSTASADLSIGKTAPAVAPVAGSDAVWTINVHNFGPSDAKDVVVTDVLQDELTFVSASGADCTADGQLVTCVVGDLANDATASIELTTHLAANTATGTVVANSASVTSTTPDENEENNDTPDVPAEPSGQLADLSIAKEAPVAPPVAGTDMTWTIKVHNFGPTNASDVVVTDTLSPELTFVSATGASCSAEGQVVTCALGTLDVNGAAVISLTTHVAAKVAPGTVLVNAATVKSSTPDNNESNDVTPQTPSEPVDTLADLSITKKASSEAPSAGKPTTWTITVVNNGPSDARDVVVSDVLTNGLTFVEASGAECVATGALVTCAVGTVENGATATIQLTTLVAQETPQGTIIANSATVSSSTNDKDPGDNDTPEVPTEPSTVDTDVVAAIAAPETAGPATRITLEVSSTDTGPAAATNVTLSAGADAGLAIESVTARVVLASAPAASVNLAAFAAITPAQALDITEPVCSAQRDGSWLCQAASLPVGARLVATVTGLVSPDATGNIGVWARTDADWVPRDRSTHDAKDTILVSAVPTPSPEPAVTPTAAAPGLATTGASMMPYLWLALGLCVGGLFFLVAARRRRSEEEEEAPAL